MTVTKRTRFEILRRDDHTCQYCGQMAPDVVLHIDHVVPVALGGSDDPRNLVAACRDCNAGKASIQPDSPLVARVSDVSTAYALTMADKFTRIKGRIEAQEEYVTAFLAEWNNWAVREGTVPLPDDWKNSLRRWHTMGVPVELLTYAVDIAMRSQKVTAGDTFRYTAGIVWRTLEEEDVTYPLSPETALMYTSSEADRFAAVQYEAGIERGYADGFHDGPVFESTRLVNQDFLAMHIDGRTDHWAWERMSHAA